MAEKVYHPEEIEDQPFPTEGEADLFTSQKTGGGVYGPKTIKDRPLPVRRTAHELLSSALNTKSRKILAEFEFADHGAIRIGRYTPGVSGDIRVTPNGIVARDAAGLTTFALDGLTGSAVFRGTIQAGTIISESEIIGGSININNVFTVDSDGNVVALSIVLGSGYSKINIFRQDGIPTSISIGDLWFDSNDNNKVYRAASIGADEIAAGEWVAVDDQRAADALLRSGATQVLTGDFNLNDANVKIDGANKRILINDGANDRILIGYHSGGF